MDAVEHVCVVCSYVHSDEEHGKWEELPDTYTCPECGVGKEDFETI
jgi:rubredoxin